MARLDRARALAVLLLGGTQASQAQDEKPTAQQIAAIRSCAEKNQDEITEAERQCLFNLVATPCQSTPEGQSNLADGRLLSPRSEDLGRLAQRELQALARCYRRRTGRQAARYAAGLDRLARYTCGFYDVKIQGSMAIPMGAACLARETARRAVLLKFFTRL